MDDAASGPILTHAQVNPRYAFLFDPGPWAPDLDGEVADDFASFLQEWLGSDTAIVVAESPTYRNRVRNLFAQEPEPMPSTPG